MKYYGKLKFRQKLWSFRSSIYMRQFTLETINILKSNLIKSPPPPPISVVRLKFFITLYDSVLAWSSFSSHTSILRIMFSSTSAAGEKIFDKQKYLVLMMIECEPQQMDIFIEIILNISFYLGFIILTIMCLVGIYFFFEQCCLKPWRKR